MVVCVSVVVSWSQGALRPAIPSLGHGTWDLGLAWSWYLWCWSWQLRSWS